MFKHQDSNRIVMTSGSVKPLSESEYKELEEANKLEKEKLAKKILGEDKKERIDAAYIPYDTYIKIEIKKIEVKSEGGILLPEKEREKKELNTEEGTLVAIGELAWAELIQNKGNAPKIGDVVIFKKFAGLCREENGKVYRIMQDIDIYGICYGICKKGE